MTACSEIPVLGSAHSCPGGVLKPFFQSIAALQTAFLDSCFRRNDALRRMLFPGTTSLVIQNCLLPQDSKASTKGHVALNGTPLFSLKPFFQSIAALQTAFLDSCFRRNDGEECFSRDDIGLFKSLLPQDSKASTKGHVALNGTPWIPAPSLPRSRIGVGDKT